MVAIINRLKGEKLKQRASSSLSGICEFLDKYNINIKKLKTT